MQVSTPYLLIVVLRQAISPLVSENPDPLVSEIPDPRATWLRAQVSLPAVAMAFAALPACVARVVIGCSAAAEVEANIAHMEQSAMVRRNVQ